MRKFLSGNFPIILILILSAFLRLYRIGDYIVFLGDEGRDALTVYNILHGHLTLLGPTASVGGFFLGPIYYYFMAPFLWLSHYSPGGPAVMVALFGIATVYLLYKIVNEFFDKKTAIITSLLYSIAPTILVYSRSSWNPNLMPFFTLLTFYTFYKALQKGKIILFALTGFLFGILMQLHYLSTFLGVELFLYLLIFYLIHKKLNIKTVVMNYATMFFGFLVGFSPFLAFEVRHGFQNTSNILTFVFHSKDTGVSNLFLSNLWQVSSRLFTGILMGFPQPNQYKLFDPNLLTFWFWFGIAVGAVSVGIFLKIVKDSIHSKEKLSFYSLLLVWFLVSLVLFGLYKKSIYDYYLGFMFPLSFIFVGATITYLFSLNKKLLPVLGLILAIIIFFQIQLNPLRYPPNKQFEATKSVAEFVIDKADGKPFNFALLTGGNSDFAYKYIFRLENKNPVVIENPEIDPERKTVTDQLLVICESLPCSPLGHPLWEIAGFGRADVVGHWKLSSVAEVYKLVHYTGTTINTH